MVNKNSRSDKKIGMEYTRGSASPCRSFPVLPVVLMGWWRPSKQSVNCSQRGSHSVFVANFDDDDVGSPPAPPTHPAHYGPPGASLNMDGNSQTIEVVDSGALGSRALKMTRGNTKPTEVEAVVGDIAPYGGQMPYTSGKGFVEFRAHGETIPQHLIAGMAISVRSESGDAALSLKLFDGSYHRREGDSYVRIEGSYDPGKAHFVHIEVNMDTRKYSICIDDNVVVSHKAFLSSGFTDLYKLCFFAPPTITEAFPSVYVVDDIRITI